MRKQKEPNWLMIIRIALAAVFLFSGFAKAINPVGFGVTMHEYFMSFGMGFLQPIAEVSGMIAITSEFILGFMLLFRIKTKLASLGYLVFMTFFFFLTMWLAIAEYLEVNKIYDFGVVRDCGCFGDAVEMSNMQTFLKNVAIMAATLIVFKMRNTIPDIRLTEFGKWLFTGIVTVLIVAFQVYSIANLPIIDFSEWKKGENVAAKFIDEPDVKDFLFVYQKGDTVVKLNANELETITDTIPEFYDTYSYVERVETVISIGDTATVKGFSMLDTEGNDFATVLINEEKKDVLFVFMYDLEDVNEDGMKALLPLISSCANAGIEIVGLTSSPEGEVAEFKKAYQLELPIYTNPTNVIRGPFIVRDAIPSNPGVILISNGIVKEKWSWRNIPSIVTEIETHGTPSQN